jgi:hypothetical protein
MTDCNEEIANNQSESISFALTRMYRLESLLHHMKQAAPTYSAVDLDAALDYTREAISELK